MVARQAVRVGKADAAGPAEVAVPGGSAPGLQIGGGNRGRQGVVGERGAGDGRLGVGLGRRVGAKPVNHASDEDLVDGVVRAEGSGKAVIHVGLYLESFGWWSMVIVVGNELLVSVEEVKRGEEVGSRGNVGEG